ncbi:MAG: phage virion morphogenesis protein [Chlorobi bacterium]|nr:phage virion morphogenesis protein [Chlorobiota bacterium]
MAAKVDDVAEFRDLFYRRMNSIDNRKFYSTIGHVLLKSIQENFDVGGRYSRSSPIGTGGTDRWFDLSEVTIAQRTKKGYWPGKILQQTGILASSITFTVNSDGVSVGSNLSYARDLQYGTDIMPPRPFLVVQEEDITKIMFKYTEYFARNLGMTAKISK